MNKKKKEISVKSATMVLMREQVQFTSAIQKHFATSKIFAVDVCSVKVDERLPYEIRYGSQLIYGNCTERLRDLELARIHSYLSTLAVSVSEKNSPTLSLLAM